MAIKVVGQINGIMRSTDNQVMVPTGNGYLSAVELGIDPNFVTIPTRYGLDKKQQVLTERGYQTIDATAGDALLSSAAQLPSLAPRVVRSNIMEEQVYGAISAAGTTASNFTYHMTIVIGTDATDFQIDLKNANTGSQFRVKSAIIATSDSIGPDPTIGSTPNQVRFTPQNGVAWKPLTWDNGVANVAIAASPGANRVTTKKSDKINAPTVPNVDGSKLRIVMVRFYVEGTTADPGNTYSVGQYPLTWRKSVADVNLHKGFIWQCLRYSGDGVTTPANFQPNVDLNGTPFMTHIRFWTRKPGIVLNGIGGDSIMAGAVNLGVGNFGNGWLWQLSNLLRDKYPNIPFSVSNNGLPSTGTAVYSQSATDYLDNSPPIGLPIYMVATQNDSTPSKANYDAAMSRAATICGRIQATGKAVALMTPIPNTGLGWTAPQDAIRLALRQEILDLQANGTTIAIDMESVGDGASPVRYQTALTVDNAHPNEAGHAVLATAILPEISKLIG